jgi:hypothetical protein
MRLFVYLRETLGLERGVGHCEVDEGDTRAQIGSEVAGRVARGHEKSERRTEIHLVIA